MLSQIMIMIKKSIAFVDASRYHVSLQQTQAFAEISHLIFTVNLSYKNRDNDQILLHYLFTLHRE